MGAWRCLNTFDVGLTWSDLRYHYCVFKFSITRVDGCSDKTPPTPIFKNLNAWGKKKGAWRCLNTFDFGLWFRLTSTKSAKAKIVMIWLSNTCAHTLPNQNLKVEYVLNGHNTVNALAAPIVLWLGAIKLPTCLPKPLPKVKVQVVSNSRYEFVRHVTEMLQHYEDLGRIWRCSCVPWM